MILGNGMLARAFAADTAFERDDVVIFAKGVSDSATKDEREFLRELRALEEAVQAANATGALFVYFSSGGAVYGEQRTRRVETCALKPVTRYGHHKRNCEEFVESRSADYLILRLPNVVDSRGSAAQLLPSLVRQVASGNVIIQRYATRDLIGSGDVVSLVARLIDKGANRDVFNLASGISTAVDELVRWIADELAVEPFRIYRNEGVPQVFSIEKLKDVIGDLGVFDSSYSENVVRNYVAIDKAVFHS